MTEVNLLLHENYHFRGQPPRLLSDGTVSKLARYEPREKNLSLRDKYVDLYVVERVIENTGKIINNLHCLICKLKVRCPQTNSNLVDFSNFFRHLQSTHVTELTIDDQEKDKKNSGRIVKYHISLFGV